MPPANDIRAEIWAKSANKNKNETRGESLETHSLNVARKFVELVERSPDLPRWVDEPRLWHRTFWSCLLHDFGKIATGFQQQVKNGEIWGHRHEVLSLAFLDWVIPPDSPDFRWAAAGIASHHRDYETSGSGGKRGTSADYPLDEKRRAIRMLVEGSEYTGANLKADYVQALIETLREQVPSLFAKYNLGALGIEQNLNLPETLDFANFVRQTPGKIADALHNYYDLVEKLKKTPPGDKLNRQAIAIRGLVILADRLASSYAPASTLVDLPDAETLFARAKKEFKGTRDHQKKAEQASGSIILSAPTGSGKTEASLFWARQQQQEQARQSNLVYILPYQASMNAMKLRLDKALFAQESDFNVALLHGRSSQVLYNQLSNVGTSPQDANRAAKRANSLARLYQPSVWVTTPYQLLKAAYRLPGYEMLWTAVAGSRLIIDEVHAYDPKRLGLFVGLLALLKKQWSIELCLMTATMPDWLKSLLQTELDIADENLIAPDDALFAHFRRHRLHQLPGSLADESVLDFIVQQYQDGKSVLVCANSVNGAQATMQALQERLPSAPEDDIILLHSRFTGEDRLKKESKISKVVNADRKHKNNPLIVVATQVIEVSLDLDFNTIVTEPAPLEALAQRFGRVNRRGTTDSPPAPVYVLNQPLDTTTDFIYDPGLLLRTGELIEREDGNELNEALLTTWLNEIYWEDLAALYRAEVLEFKGYFDRDCSSRLRAFQSDESLEKQFEELFDGVEVIPVSLLEVYKTALKESALAAARYRVPVSQRQIQHNKNIVRQQIPIEQEDETTRQPLTVWEYIAHLPYSPETGLALKTQAEGSGT